MTIIYHEEDGNLADLAGRRVGVIGYGNMGRPVALNLRDSGVECVVCDNRRERMEAAWKEGFQTRSIEEVVQMCDILLLLYRDEAMPQIYLEQVSPYLRRGQMLIFSSAYNVAFGFIEAPPFVDVGLVAPRTVGAAMRDRFLRGEGFASFVAVGQDATGQAWRTVLGIALALGALRLGAVEIRFEQEAELDLFLQQAVLPAFHHIVITAAQLLMEQGFPPDAVFTELYLSGETADYLAQASRIGLMETLKLASLTGQYGTLSRYDRFKELKIERLMEITLDEIRNGRFAQEWSKEFAADYPRLKQLMKLRERMELWEIEQQTLEFLRRDGNDHWGGDDRF
jgi:ketol-acid reductoisomerase